MSDVTRILSSIDAGDPKAAEELLPLVYEELRRLAAAKMAMEAPGHTLQPTALVHEAWLRLAGEERTRWEGRAQFFSAAAEAMRRILIDRARKRKALKRGGAASQEPLNDADFALNVPSEELLAVHESLEQLSQEDPQAADLVMEKPIRMLRGCPVLITPLVSSLSFSSSRRAGASHDADDMAGCPKTPHLGLRAGISNPTVNPATPLRRWPLLFPTGRLR